MKKAALLATTLGWMTVCLPVAGQDGISATTAVQQAILTSGRAVVKVFAFDTVQQVQTGGPFSAVVVSADGFLLTAAHASRPGHTYLVTFPGGKTAVAVGMGRIDTDEKETLPDIATMKLLAAGPWPFAEMGTAVGKGDACMMLAYPESTGLPFPTLRFGFVTDPADGHGFLVSGCTMEVGDSGGPVFDMSGRVIGVNSRCQAAEARNHHVPVTEYRKYWSSLTRQANYRQYPQPDSGWDLPAPPAIVPLLPPGALVIQGAALLVSKGKTTGGTVWRSCKRGTFIIGKLSDLGDTVWLKAAGGKGVRLKVVARNPGNDLVLLYSGKDLRLPGVENLLRNLEEPAPGGFLFAALPGGKQKRGITGTGTFDMPPRLGSGYFGAKLVDKNTAVAIAFLDPEGPAARSGFLPDDQLLRINGLPSTGFINDLQHYQPHQTITVTFQRGDSLLRQSVTLAQRPEAPASNHPAEMYEGGKSARRDGFTKVWFSDMHISSTECGSPVFDDQARFCGIAIARYSRTATVILHATEIVRWMGSLSL
ncbi:S1 family peptidase [Chitinophaga rhizosphaerae]|uniref:S1 family peptidase n=1 Tax=Chitinophaga rhizosphaerae TaxID=1864947 RepID=UPI0013DFF1CB|nr:trypsin-like peptidase domain-containing protein [Chitinophaga rhizosphaerae]